MAYTIRLIEQPSGGWLVEVWMKDNRVYTGAAPSQSKESARGEGKMVLYHKDEAARFTIIEIPRNQLPPDRKAAEFPR
jgi:hypothetical protein